MTKHGLWAVKLKDGTWWGENDEPLLYTDEDFAVDSLGTARHFNATLASQLKGARVVPVALIETPVSTDTLSAVLALLPPAVRAEIAQRMHGPTT